jgi:hypothetical protein
MNCERNPKLTVRHNYEQRPKDQAESRNPTHWLLFYVRALRGVCDFPGIVKTGEVKRTAERDSSLIQRTYSTHSLELPKCLHLPASRQSTIDGFGVRSLIEWRNCIADSGFGILLSISKNAINSIPSGVSSIAAFIKEPFLPFLNSAAVLFSTWPSTHSRI